MAKLIPENIKNRTDIPHAIRKLATQFEMLSPDALIWYEPLFDSVGDKPDFVVWLPDRGLAIIEVLEAKVEGILGFRRGKIRILRNGEEVRIDNPIAKATALATKLSARILEEPRVRSLNIKVAAAACLPHMTKSDVQRSKFDNDFAAKLTIFKDDLIEEETGALITSAFERLLGPAVRSEFSIELDQVIRGLVQPDIVINRVAQSSEQLKIFQPPQEDQDIIRVMDREQESLAKSMGDGHRIIRGVAGSGKTLILVFRARLLATCNPRSNYLVVCYTKTLAGQLTRLLADLPNVDVTNVDKLAKDLCDEAGIKIFHGSEYDSEAVIEGALKALAAGKGKRYNGILVDEAQDLDTNALRLLGGLFKEGSNDLIIVADAAQNIFSRKFSWKQAGIQAQGRTRLLRINYRNTRQILEFASSFLLGDKQEDSATILDDEHAFIPPESTKRVGQPPAVHLVRDVREEVRETVRLVLDQIKGFPQQKVAILYPGVDGTDRGGLLERELSQHGIKYFSFRKDEGAKSRMGASSEQVILSTVHSSKGLEFPRVIVCGTWTDRVDLDSNRKLTYVGMTRATDYLAVVSRQDHELAVDLRKACEKLGIQPSSTVPLQLKVNPPANNAENKPRSIPPLKAVTIKNPSSPHSLKNSKAPPPAVPVPAKPQPDITRSSEMDESMYEAMILGFVNLAGPCGITTTTIAEKIGKEKAFVNNTLHRLSHFGKVQQLNGGVWVMKGTKSR